MTGRILAQGSGQVPAANKKSTFKSPRRLTRWLAFSFSGGQDLDVDLQASVRPRAVSAVVRIKGKLYERSSSD